ncbi:DNA repair protein RecO [Treponema bryantii]|uniref:DNA repair protein RecO n=1 Tax=Treponema bryantii TaxID=163 RepID=UPI002B2C2CD9|nr:recombinase RecO [Treponema bryantii]
MNRSSSTSAIILSLKPLGENNSSVTLLTPDNGILYAVLYGGPKSRMRSLVSQWNSGKVWLYENPEKNQIKISDFEVSNYHTSFSQNLFKSYAASLAAELAIKTRCAGSAQQCHRLVSGFLDGMELCDEEQSRLGLLRFLWRYLELLGIQPQSHACSNCGKTFLDTRFAPEAVSYYNSMENSFICPDCADHLQGENMLSVKNTAVQYLSALTVLTPSEARKLTIDEEIYGQIRQLVFFLIENSIDQKLNSIETGMGIL